MIRYATLCSLNSNVNGVCGNRASWDSYFRFSFSFQTDTVIFSQHVIFRYCVSRPNSRKEVLSSFQIHVFPI